MKIFVIGNLTPYVLGGAEQQARLLVEGWAARGHRIYVAGSALPNTDEAIKHFSITCLRIRVPKRFGRLGRGLGYAASLAVLLFRYRNKIDVVYCRFLAEGAVVTAFLKSIGIISVPLVACPASGGGGGEGELLRTLWGGGFLVKLLSRQCDVINLISEQIEKELVNIGVSPARWARVPNGVSVSRIPAPFPRVPPLKLIFVGGLRRQKGVDLLLQAVAESINSGVNVELCIVGDGPDRESLKILARELGVADRTKFLGAVDNAGISFEISSCHVFVLPSRWEGMSNAALEAISAGRPVIVSDCGGIDRFVDPRVGWVIGLGDAKGLSSAIQRASVLTHSQLSEMGRQAHEIAKREFDIVNSITAYLTIFSEITKID
ncbi:MAG: glycosyltransferase family 4 protein [Pseudomonadota bacterium]|nr:glycosyltransferase family 4 protein [Pseudomonadota bacterium]